MKLILCDYVTLVISFVPHVPERMNVLYYYHHRRRRPQTAALDTNGSWRRHVKVELERNGTEME